MTVIKLTPQEGKANPCYFHPELPSSVLVIRKVAGNVTLCGICHR